MTGTAPPRDEADRARCRGDDGFWAPGFTMAIVIALVAVIGLSLDGGRMLAARRAAGDAAHEAARVGAQQIDLNATATAHVATLDPGGAEAAAGAFLDSVGYPDHSVQVSCDGGRCASVTVTVRRATLLVLLGLVGVSPRPVIGHGTARVAQGVTQENG